VDDHELSEWFEPVPTSVLAARQLVGVLRKELPPGTMDDVRLVVSELAANAVMHAQTRYHVRLRVGPTVRVEVTDASPTLPVVQSSSDSGRGGRGLAIVNALAQQWGVDPLPDGKIVWADLGPTPR
jgi:anti-sigma regulatory factor (Ser/Thr protein kinase)